MFAGNLESRASYGLTWLGRRWLAARSSPVSLNQARFRTTCGLSVILGGMQQASGGLVRLPQAEALPETALINRHTTGEASQ
jgi:hypothetical protein